MKQSVNKRLHGKYHLGFGNLRQSLNLKLSLEFRMEILS